MPVSAAPSRATLDSSDASPCASPAAAPSGQAGGRIAPRGSSPVASIDLAALAHNFEQVRRLTGGRTGVLAMVKSDAYGHGAALCAPALARAGCESFGVATAAEALELAEVLDSRARRRVVVFGGVLPDEAGDLVDAGAEVATQEIEVVRALGQAAAARGREVRVHVKLDTGMHRLGVAPGHALEFVRAAASLPSVRVVALCSHFALAESVTGEVTAGQLETMLAVDATLRGAGFALERHLANSAAILARPEAWLDAVRPGIMLYGVAPDPALAGLADLRPVMRLRARVVRVADVDEGDGVGYGHTWTAPRPSRIATVRCGYADGYPRALGNAGVAMVAGRRVPVVGRVCMDHSMFDVSGAGDVRVGDEVVLWGDEPAVGEVAAAAGTIPYEMLARTGRRVRRVPVGD